MKRRTEVILGFQHVAVAEDGCLHMTHCIILAAVGLKDCSTWSGRDCDLCWRMLPGDRRYLSLLCAPAGTHTAF